MATLVNRTIWHRNAAKIHSAIVTRQRFNPDCIYATRDDGVELQLSPSSFFLTPQEAIADARDEAELILYFADQFEGNLQSAPVIRDPNFDYDDVSSNARREEDD